MREIKFKCLIECSDEKKDMGFPKTKWVNFNLNFGKYIFPEYKQISPDLQFTGLKDKNGVDIYEGDVLFHEKHNRKTIMKWIKDYACFAGETIDEIVEGEYNYYQKIDKSKLEIIGNIHEHPNLLNNE